MGYIDKIIVSAKSYLGQEEIQPNLGFKDSILDSKMRKQGFYRGASWCGFFIKVVMNDVYEYTEYWKQLSHLLSASTHEMWINFTNSKYIFFTSKIPKIGSIVIWQEGDGTNGHTGIVTSVSDDGNHFTSIEGNSNNDGSINGYMVAENKHTLGLPHNIHGLNILGFIYMPD